jgi:2-alkenal reductase
MVDTSDRAVRVVQRVGPAVVTIQTSGVDDQGNQFQAAGSGVIIDNKGDILTNYHVVQGNETSYQVIFKSGAKAGATLAGSAPYSDLAVIHVNTGVPAWAPLGDSSKVQPGETVLAIGSPLGSYENTVTEGIVSAVGRTLQEPNNGPLLTNLLQTDAPINHGNSGGPLVDLDGKVIGINTAVVRSSSDTGNPQDPFGGLLSPFGDVSSGDQAQGLGFAIPSNTAHLAISRILFHRPPGYLGVEARLLDPQTATFHNWPMGAYVLTVQPGTPAAKAGLRPQDIITAVDGQPIDQNHDLSTLIEMHQPGQTITLSVFRAGQNLAVHVKLGARPKNV